MMQKDFTDLMTKGFIVLEQFLPDDLCEKFREDYRCDHRYENPNYHLKAVDVDLLISLRSRLSLLLAAINATTDLSVDYLIPIAAYTDTAVMNFGYHQDHESFYILQQNYDYLNFYIPIIKPVKSLSGIDVIPFDSLRTLVPEFISQLERRGANRYHTDKDHTIKIDDNNGRSTRIPIDLDAVKMSPHLAVGDLLLMRGDVIHKTQDQFCQRVALSVRCTSSQRKIYRYRHFIGCEQKRQIISKNPQAYASLDQLLESHSEITVEKIYQSRGGLRLC